MITSKIKAWTIKNPNQALPQDLFPTPIKVLDDNELTWTFIQPIDTHQLSNGVKQYVTV
jgi:hypothetical protein